MYNLILFFTFFFFGLLQLYSIVEKARKSGEEMQPQGTNLGRLLRHAAYTVTCSSAEPPQRLYKLIPKALLHSAGGFEAHVFEIMLKEDN